MTEALLNRLRLIAGARRIAEQRKRLERMNMPIKALLVKPDWSNLAMLESQIGPFLDPTGKFEFAGPGFYLTNTDTLLIVPQTKPEVDLSWWKTKQPADMTYDVYCWNANVEQTIFGGVGLIPTRRDERE